jgi:hypothetical protein
MIAREGTSADRQLALFKQAERGGAARDVFRPIIDQLKRETLADTI